MNMTETKIILIVLFVSLMPLIVLIGYTLLTIIISKFYRRPAKKSFENLPPVSIIIGCYNEEESIGQRIESFLLADEWIEDSELIVVSGGSTDHTNEILCTFKNRNEVVLILSEERMTKIKAVNYAVSIAKHEILIFSDCRQKMKSGSVKNLVANFADPDIGTVTSMLLPDVPKAKGSMRTILNFVSLRESNSGSCLNVFGALYAQRKSVFRTIPENLLFDDLFVVVSTLSQQKRLIMEPKAVLYDVPFETYYQSDRVKRLTRGLLIFLNNNFALIWRLKFWVFCRFMIFKYLKLLIPFGLFSAFICALILIFTSHWNVVSLILAMSLFILIACVAKQIKHFVAINLYMFTATLRYYVLNDKSNSWNKLNTNK